MAILCVCEKPQLHIAEMNTYEYINVIRENNVVDSIIGGRSTLKKKQAAHMLNSLTWFHSIFYIYFTLICDYLIDLQPIPYHVDGKL